MTPLANIDAEHRGDVAIARLRGEIDASNVRWIAARMRSLVTNHSHALAVELSETTYVDSAGIALLFALAAELEQRRQRLVIVVAEGSPIARMVSLTGLGQAAETFPALDAALASLSSHLA